MDRTKGIGGTDIAAIIGLNPWKSPIDVYMEKLGLSEPQEDNEAMWWGREMEPILQKRYEKETGLTVDPPVFYTHPDYFWYVGNPDGLIFADAPGYLGCVIVQGGVDYKTTGYSKLSDWGEAGTDEVPPYYHTQAMWYMGLTGAQWWDIAVLFMGARREFRIYRINRDDELIATLIEKGREFWEQHIIPQIPPAVDASPSWDKFFKAKWPKEEEDLIELDIENDFNLYIDAIKDWTYQIKSAEFHKTFYENKVKEFIGSHSGLKSPIGKITWKKSKDRQVVDWETAFNMLKEIYSVSYKDALRLIKQNTTTKPGPRVFKTYWKKEEE